MNEYDVSDYGIFSNAVSTTNSLNENIEKGKVSITECKTSLDNESIFMGPICDSCIEAFSDVDVRVNSLNENFSKIASYITETASNYQSGDNSASTTLLRIDSGAVTATTSTAGKTTGGNAISSVTIPTSVNQAGYTVTCYGEGGWYLGGGSSPTAVASGTKQKSVHEAWLADGARYKNGIAVMHVDGEDHYLIATAPTLGNVGDSVNVNLENGQTVPCVIADAKSTGDSNYTTYGHGRSDGSVNVLEFEVDRNVYNTSGNPTTSKWGLEWDSSSDVSSVDNYGSIV